MPLKRADHLDKTAIVAFASQFDPQPYHLDKEAAEQSIFGGLCASGWHIAALATRLVNETLIENGLPFIEIGVSRPPEVDGRPLSTSKSACASH
ncbi:MAG: hypothetical protein CM15mP125_1200 [Gammaproteobacteria bacterium]|nr:MAG: hypothetical protein CM15mP125_1200 [Gammaproteobacteria bacterium]